MLTGLLKRIKPNHILAVLAVLAVVIWCGGFFIVPQRLEVVFFDVGEGLCAVIITPSGKTMIVDCGTSSWRQPQQIGEKVVLPYLRKRGITSIDVAMLTHPHSDHISGFPVLFEYVRPKIVMDIDNDHNSAEYDMFLHSVKNSGGEYRIMRTGQRLDFGDGVTADILSAGKQNTLYDLNNQSAVVRIHFKETAVLISADAEEETERLILSRTHDVKSQVLLVGHHGSESATTAQWINAVSPSVAVISCGRNNEYGHPSDSVVERLEMMNVRVYRTDVHGAVSIMSDGTSVTASPHKSPR